MSPPQLLSASRRVHRNGLGQLRQRKHRPAERARTAQPFARLLEVFERQAHAYEKDKCNHCGKIVDIPKYASHIKQECPGVITRNCKYCSDPVKGLYYDKHVKYHEAKQREQDLIYERRRMRIQQQALQPKQIKNNTPVTTEVGWPANDNHCRHCGKIAMPGSSACYNCGDK